MASRMTLHALPEIQPRIRRTLVDFMSTEQFEALRDAPQTVRKEKK